MGRAPSCICGSCSRCRNNAHVRAHYQRNRERILAQKAERYREKRKQILEQKRQARERAKRQEWHDGMDNDTIGVPSGLRVTQLGEPDRLYPYDEWVATFGQPGTHGTIWKPLPNE